MNYEQKYKAALEWMQGMYGGLHGKTKEEAEKYFPELKDSEDERIRKVQLDYWRSVGGKEWHGVPVQEVIAWLENQGQVKESPILQQENKTCCKNGNSLTCKNDTLLDLLQKMPSCITVDGLDYYFVMKKASYYIAYYKAIGEEGRGNAIFAMTAFSPIDLLNEMLEKLKEEQQ